MELQSLMDIELFIHYKLRLWWLDVLIMVVRYELSTLLALIEMFQVGTLASSIFCSSNVYVSEFTNVKNLLLPIAFLFLDQSIVRIYLNFRCWFHAI